MVNLNNHTGSSEAGNTIICEKDVKVDQEGTVEVRDAAGHWWAATVRKMNADGTYDAELDKTGSVWTSVWQFNVRRHISDDEVKAALQKKGWHGALRRHGWENQTKGNASNASKVAHTENDFAAETQSTTAQRPSGFTLPPSMHDTANDSTNATTRSFTNDADQSSTADNTTWGPKQTIEGQMTDFIQGQRGVNACPEGYKVIGDPRTCRRAMVVLKLGPWGRKDQWADRPSGCFVTPTGIVNLNNNTGDDISNSSIICEPDVQLGVADVYQARTATGDWIDATVTSKNGDLTYTATLKDGTEWDQVWQFNIRTKINFNTTQTAIHNGEQNDSRYNSFNKAWYHDNDSRAAQQAGSLERATSNMTAHRQAIKEMLDKDAVVFARRREMLKKLLEKKKDDGSKVFPAEALQAARRAYINSAKTIARLQGFLQDSSPDDTAQVSLERWHKTMHRAPKMKAHAK